MAEHMRRPLGPLKDYGGVVQDPVPCDRCTKADRLLRQALLILDHFSNDEVNARCGDGTAGRFRLRTQVLLGERDEVEL
jgi:hypothetical protein